MIGFALTIFLSAFLLFQVQPLIGKYILPWFGGGPAVWTACMLFFQAVLLMGYAYAHLLSTKLSGRGQVRLHLGLLALSLLVLPISPDPETWKPLPGDEPTLHILLLLAATVGAPYLLLSSTSPLVQRWFSQAFPGQSPYRLYALSNAGSLLALVSYPFVVEPLLALGNQVAGWSWAYGVFAVLASWCALRPSLPVVYASVATVEEPRTASGMRTDTTAAPARVSPPTPTTILLWLGLAAAASSMLLASTNQMCQEVAVVPFLWVLPLALYLLTFIICFEHERWYKRRWFAPLLGVCSLAACGTLYGGAHIGIRTQIFVYSLTLFACCMCCHGELARSKPHPQRLTFFYMVLAAGGALGGLFVAVAAPHLFPGYWEFHISLAACLVLTMIAAYRASAWRKHFREPLMAWGGLALLLLVVVSTLAGHAYLRERNALVTRRNFYGVLRLTENQETAGRTRSLAHGKIVHGLQFLDPSKRHWPTAYYGPQSGLGLALEHHPRRSHPDPAQRSLRVGVVGLGVGTAATYGRPGDYLRFYELDPEVQYFAERYFTFLRNSPAQIEIALGDARVQLEREGAQQQWQQFDVLAVDAFSSDAIPAHLLTEECADLYWRHLDQDGILLFHITNRSLDLTPVVRGLARKLQCRVLRTRQGTDNKKGLNEASWMALTNNQAFLELAQVQAVADPWSEDEAEPLLWTDDFVSLWQVLTWE